ncbi:MAG TPA: flavin reductase [Steroidobacteraceae bacterium]|jgi:3-hydroxy-9,10-secoandrosta-1,3,5(10)-triene-9,17-dione monooxygenase reductase component|nr:flavin reductase [Steroidobacteraceae bacterium]
MPPEYSPDDARRFRSALGAFATGVTIVTSRDAAGKDVGLTANSFNSVSLEPPMVLWSLARSARSLPAFLAANRFAVHVLAADQEELSLRFAARGSDKFAGLDLERGPGELPMLRGCSARFLCRTAFRHESGDHVIFVGEVEAFDHSDRPPLLFHGGRYALAVQKEISSDPATETGSGFSDDFLVYLLARAHFQLFISLRRDLEEHGLTEAQWLALSVLGVPDGRSMEELDRLLWHTGQRATPQLLASLTAAGLAALQGHAPDVRISLTVAGRRALIELVASAKAAEAHAERNFGTAEIRLLKRALRAIVRETDPGAPPPSVD